MLVPSGNDAAYVVADYCGSILSPQAKNSQERINVFMEHLNNYLQIKGMKTQFYMTQADMMSMLSLPFQT